MLVPLIKIKQIDTNNHILKEIYINPDQIVYISENYSLTQKLKEGKITLDLHPETSFTKIKINLNGYVEEITVIGAPGIIERKINNSARRLLRG